MATPGDNPPMEPGVFLPVRYEPAEAVGTYDEGPSRDPAGAHVYRSGRTLLNPAATHLALRIAGNPRHPERGGAFLAGDPLTNEVAGVLLSGVGQTLTPVRYNAQENTLTVYLTDLFKRSPRYRPAADKWVVVAERTEENKTFFVIQLGQLLRPKKGSRAADGKALGQQPRAEAAPAAEPGAQGERT